MEIIKKKKLGGVLHFMFSLFLSYSYKSYNSVSKYKVRTALLNGLVSICYHQTKSNVFRTLDHLMIHLNINSVLLAIPSLSMILKSNIKYCMSFAMVLDTLNDLMLFLKPSYYVDTSIPRALSMICSYVVWGYALWENSNELKLLYVLYLLSSYIFLSYKTQSWHIDGIWGPHEDFHVVLIISEYAMIRYLENKYKNVCVQI